MLLYLYKVKGKFIMKKIILIIIVTIILIISSIIVLKNIQKENLKTDTENLQKQNITKIDENVMNEILSNNNSIEINEDENGNKNIAIKKLIVVKVEEKSLKTMDSDENLDIIYLKNEDTSRFKQGQEILIVYDGVVLTTYPGQIYADKAIILKEKSNVEIPIEVLRYYNFSQKKINVEIENFTKEKMEFIIKDENEYPLEYGEDFSYSIFKKNVENEEYNQNLEFDYNSYTPPVTTEEYSATSSYSPDTNRLKKVWEELEIIGEGNNENCSWEDISENYLKLKGTCDWSELYENLNEGEYEIRINRNCSESDQFFRDITVNFKVDVDGNVEYENPEFGW